MEKVIIGGKEYTEEEALELVQKGEDYTKKTMDLAEQKKVLDNETEYAKVLRGMDEYANTHPEFKQQMDTLIEKERAKATGQPYVPPVVSPAQDPGTDPPEEEYVSKTELNSILEKDRKARQIEDQNKAVNQQVFSDMETLRAKGYTKEELEKIGNIAGKSSRFPVEVAERMAFRNEIPNRFIKKELDPESNEEKLKLLKGSSGSGFEISKEEKEYIETGGDPGELLRKRVAEKPGLLIKKE